MGIQTKSVSPWSCNRLELAKRGGGEWGENSRDMHKTGLQQEPMGPADSQLLLELASIPRSIPVQSPLGPKVLGLIQLNPELLNEVGHKGGGGGGGGLKGHAPDRVSATSNGPT